MKITGRTSITTGAIFAACIVILTSAGASAGPPRGIDPSNHNLCTIYNGYWSNQPGSDGISLRTAIFLANSNDHSSCRTGITLTTDVSMATPLVIKRAGILIEGNNRTLNASSMDPEEGTDGADGHRCAIYVEADNVTIRNLNLQNAAGGRHHGICFAGSGSRLANVRVANGGDAIVMDGSNNQVTDARVSVSHHGVVLKGSGNILTTSGMIAHGTTIDAAGNGVVVKGSDNRLIDVEISAGRHGIYFERGSSGNRILPNVVVSGVGDAACDPLEGGEGEEEGAAAEPCYSIADASISGNLNTVIFTNKKPNRIAGEGDDTDPETGFINWETDATGNIIYLSLTEMLGNILTAPGSTANPAMDLKLAGSGVSPFGSVRTAVPIITYIDGVGSSEYYRVYGAMREIDPSELGDDGKYNCDAGSAYTNVNRLALYVYRNDAMEFAGLVGVSGTRGMEEGGLFEFVLDKGSDAMAGVSKFVLLPVGDDYTIEGRSSNYITAANEYTDCRAGTGEDIGGSSGGGGVGRGPRGLGQGNLMEYWNVPACNADLNYGEGVYDDADSDLDNIPDYIERSIMKATLAADLDCTAVNGGLTYVRGNSIWVFDPASGTCAFDRGVQLSSWYLADTDGDGIRDDKDGYVSNWLKYYRMRIQRRTTFASLPDTSAATTDVNNKCARIVNVTNTDGAYPAGASDAYPDVNDPDSDNDDWEDGEEDRARIFNQGATSYFYKITDSIGEPFYPSAESNGVKVACNDVLRDAGKGYIGNHYGIYVIGGIGENYVAKPIPYNEFTADSEIEKEGRYVTVLECRNETVKDNKDFSGSYESGRGETSARDPDTDDDCVCDGGGVGCAAVDTMLSQMPASLGAACNAAGAHNGESVMAHPEWLNDMCPELRHDTNDCTAQCIDGESLMRIFYTAPEYVTGDGQNMTLAMTGNTPTLFTLTVTDDVTGLERPDWERVKQVCGDTDRDGIPDCVERKPTYRCPPTSQVSQQLDPYRKDTDGDGLVDGMEGGDADVCPFPPIDRTRLDADRFNATGSGYNCDPRRIYTRGDVPEILSCYLDRDGDGLRDCEEDLDMDGRVGSPVEGLDGIARSESDPLDLDSDDDGIMDFPEVRGWPARTNARDPDTDDDGLSDYDEDRNGDQWINISLVEGQGCSAALIDPTGGNRDVDPADPDTDDDGLSDKLELMGPDHDRDEFLRLIMEPQIWSEGGIPQMSNPLAFDSDGDRLSDSEEYNGSFILYNNSNPCMPDSDGDGTEDKGEEAGCRLNPGPCVPSEDGSFDWDNDGLPDNAEARLGTDPRWPDSDNDGIEDGDEDANHNGIHEPALGESDPHSADTDGDGLNDGLERRYGTDPTVRDTDGDCIEDGVEDANRNGLYDRGTESNALSVDTDNDGLPDGWVPATGMGEDLNCNGTRDADAEGHYTETDPRNPDSDNDGNSDFNEMTDGGYFNLANMGRATQGSEGCSLVAGATGVPTGGMFVMAALLALSAVRFRRIRRRERSPA